MLSRQYDRGRLRRWWCQQSPGARWVILSFVDGYGARTHVACLTPPDRLAADSLEVDAIDIDRLVADLGCSTRGMRHPPISDY
jgi:hypothetical protein